MRALIARWGPVAVCMAAIFALSAQSTLPQAPGDLLDIAAKKLGHALGYGLLGVALCRGICPRGPIARRHLLAALAVAVAYAASDELHQLFVPNRVPSLTDVGIDALGALVGVKSYQRLRRRGIHADGP